MGSVEGDVPEQKSLAFDEPKRLLLECGHTRMFGSMPDDAKILCMQCKYVRLIVGVFRDD